VSSLEEAINDPHYECCTFRGSIIAYDMRTGKRMWQTFMMDPPRPQGVNAAGARRMGPSGVAIWGTPVIDEQRHQIYTATGDNYSDPRTKTSDAVLALDLATGRIKWTWQALAGDAWNAGCVSEIKTLCPESAGPDYDFGAAPILARSSTQRQFILVGQKSGWVFAVDPDRGKLVWKQRVGRGGIEGGIHFGMAVAGDRLFVPINDMTDAVYGVKYPEAAKPGVYALNIGSGRTLWAQPNDGALCKGRAFCTGGFSAAVAVSGELVLTGSIDGWLRFHDAGTGQILWQYDTTQTVKTVGGGETTGGSIAGGTSPIAYRGMVIATSGYDFSGKMPGNVLLVFDTERARK
jgi:polyvinyl alcohol dehydrogenase (cytochrome)